MFKRLIVFLIGEPDEGSYTDLLLKYHKNKQKKDYGEILDKYETKFLPLVRRARSQSHNDYIEKINKILEEFGSHLGEVAFVKANRDILREKFTSLANHNLKFLQKVGDVDAELAWLGFKMFHHIEDVKSFFGRDSKEKDEFYHYIENSKEYKLQKDKFLRYKSIFDEKSYYNRVAYEEIFAVLKHLYGEMLGLIKDDAPPQIDHQIRRFDMPIGQNLGKKSLHDYIWDIPDVQKLEFGDKLSQKFITKHFINPEKTSLKDGSEYYLFFPMTLKALIVDLVLLFNYYLMWLEVSSLNIKNTKDALTHIFSSIDEKENKLGKQLLFSLDALGLPLSRNITLDMGGYTRNDLDNIFTRESRAVLLEHFFLFKGLDIDADTICSTIIYDIEWIENRQRNRLRF